MFYYNNYWGMNFFWWIIWIICVIWIFTRWGRGHTKDTSYDILRKRFASGEITKEEYQEAKKVLEEDFQKISRENKV